MSNLESAHEAIEAELSHAKEGLEFYHSRVEALEKVLACLAHFDENVSSIDVPRKISKHSGKRFSTYDAGKANKAGQKKNFSDSDNRHDLPSTGGDYWPSLVIEQPRSAPEILAVAIASLNFSPSKSQTQKLAGRMTFALNALVKANKIESSGAGRERRFFKL